MCVCMCVCVREKYLCGVAYTSRIFFFEWVRVWSVIFFLEWANFVMYDVYDVSLCHVWLDVCISCMKHTHTHTQTHTRTHTHTGTQTHAHMYECIHTCICTRCWYMMLYTIPPCINVFSHIYLYIHTDIERVLTYISIHSHRYTKHSPVWRCTYTCMKTLYVHINPLYSSMYNVFTHIYLYIHTCIRNIQKGICTHPYINMMLHTIPPCINVFIYVHVYILTCIRTPSCISKLCVQSVHVCV